MGDFINLAVIICLFVAPPFAGLTIAILAWMQFDITKELLITVYIIWVILLPLYALLKK